MKIVGKIVVRLLVWSLLAPLCGGCASEQSELDTVPQGAIRFSAQQLELRGGTSAASATAPDPGEYYLGYKENKEPVLNPIQIGAGGGVGETGLYWIRVTKDEADGANFTLSNVNQKDEIPENRDILWAKDKQWGGKLQFTLAHLMAQVVVKLSFGDLISSDDIKAVYLVGVGSDILFDRAAGTVATTPTTGETELTASTMAGQYHYLFPAQNRSDAMQLKVVTTSGEAYARKLPFAMSQDIGGGNREDIPLCLRSGYILNLEAKVTKEADLNVFFTGATLVDWQKVADATIAAKPAGIYTSNELLQWAAEYERSRAKTNIHLRRYGTYDDAIAQWIFTIKRAIACTAPTSVVITSFVDHLIGERVTGVKQEQLLVLGAVGSVADGIFDN